MRQEGYGQFIDRESGKLLREVDTVQCRHCQRHIEVKPGSACTVYLLPDLRQPSLYREEAGAWCRLCDGPVCLPCHDRGVCEHFMKQIERSETETAKRDIRARLGHITVMGDFR